MFFRIVGLVVVSRLVVRFSRKNRFSKSRFNSKKVDFGFFEHNFDFKFFLQQTDKFLRRNFFGKNGKKMQLCSRKKNTIHKFCHPGYLLEFFPSIKYYGDDTTPYNYNSIIGQKIVSKILSIVAQTLLICCPPLVHSPPCQSPEHRGCSSPCGLRLNCPKPNPNRSDLHHRYKSNKMEFRRGPCFPDTKPARSLTVCEPILKRFHANYLCHVMLDLTIGRYNERISRCNVCKTKKEERFV